MNPSAVQKAVVEGVLAIGVTSVWESRDWDSKLALPAFPPPQSEADATA